MSLGNEQWIENLNELWLDPNRNYHKFEPEQRAGCLREARVDRLQVEDWREDPYGSDG